MDDDLGPLEDITRMVLDAELAKLRRLSDETRQRQDEIDRLGAALAARAVALKAADPVDDLAFRSGRDAAWQAWVGQARKRMAREAAEIASRREAQRLAAQRAFGQVQALAGIREVEGAERRQRVARRLYADPDGPGSSG